MARAAYALEQSSRASRLLALALIAGGDAAGNPDRAAAGPADAQDHRPLRRLARDGLEETRVWGPTR
jgi:hypothetical protein